MRKQIFATCLLAIGGFSVFPSECNQDDHYLIKKGDTLSEITFQNFGVPIWGKGGNLQLVISCNSQIRDPNLIYENDHLVLPYRREADAIVSKGLRSPEEKLSGKIKEGQENNDGKSLETPSTQSQKTKTSWKWYGALYGFASDFSATQTRSSGIYTRSNEILSEVRFGIELGLTKKIGSKSELGFGLGTQLNSFRKDLDPKIEKNDDLFSSFFNIMYNYQFHKYMALNSKLRFSLYPYYFGNVTSNKLEFDQEFFYGPSLGVRLGDLKLGSFGFSLTPSYSYLINGGDWLGNASGYDLLLSIRHKKLNSWELFIQYESMKYDFFSSDIKYESLRFGLKKTFN